MANRFFNPGVTLTPPPTGILVRYRTTLYRPVNDDQGALTCECEIEVGLTVLNFEKKKDDQFDLAFLSR